MRVCTILCTAMKINKISMIASSTITRSPEKSSPEDSVITEPRLTVKAVRPKIQILSRNSIWIKNPLKLSITPIDIACAGGKPNFWKKRMFIATRAAVAGIVTAMNWIAY